MLKATATKATAALLHIGGKGVPNMTASHNRSPYRRRIVRIARDTGRN